MDRDDVTELLDSLRRIGGEPETVEAKSGAGGFPTSVRESLVAFANTEGGTVLIGVDEETGFTVVPIPSITRYRDNLVALARDAITPPLQIETDIVEVDGGAVLVAQVAPSRPDHKPVYVTSKGVTNGAYLRTGDGDRRMSEGEIGLVYAARVEARYDREPVPGTGTQDLDWPSLRRSLQRVRAGSAKLRVEDETVVLFRLGVLAEPQPESPLTLAGLLAFGEYPQRMFPQLMVSVVVYPADRAGGTRFLDNVTVRGSIPDMVSEALAVIRRNLAARAVMGEFGRTDRLEYPLESIREALVNALLHRDYSPLTQGTQVQVELHPDRLTIRSPGGLYGGLITDELGEAERASSSRNGLLAGLLSDTYLPGSEDLVAENRSTGIPTMIGLARSNGLPRPVFTSTLLGFTVTMGRSELLGPDVRAWIAGLGVPVPTPAHEIALAMMRGGPVTNAMLREWGADRIAAGQVLRDLVAQGIAVREGGRRYARYVLDPSRSERPALRTLWDTVDATGTPNTTQLVADELRSRGDASAEELGWLTGLSRPTIVAHLNRLIEQDLAVAEGSRNSPKRRYRWTGMAGINQGKKR
ncbi:ATP-binding protein [Cellulomonas fimi]|uniref:Transcriptional regulator n=1 Tax=Cellulomonas fimi TaxID=1708 RepID=A0A7Y0QHS5_CELFI|nr:ATP-binding protein [Cellulomonas fimi]NMR20463.1 transcriptional regulator [Cellulomonas fimi]